MSLRGAKGDEVISIKAQILIEIPCRDCLTPLAMTKGTPLMIFDFPKAIVHVDGDAFFASCEQARNPRLRGKPVITGKERGIAASLSYEAKSRGVRRAMRLADVKRLCPEAILLPSDYESYSLLSKRFFDIVRRFTPEVEECGIDECFANITGLRRPLRMSYPKIAKSIQQALQRELGFTFSVGLAPNKVLAKIASKWQKPCGFTAIPGRQIHQYIRNLPLDEAWGIGGQTKAYLAKYGIHTVLDFARKDSLWVEKVLNKPHFEIWQELNGKFVFTLDTGPKTSYASIQKVKTFTPPSNDKNFIFAQLVKNIENACIKARRYKLSTPEVVFFLKTQQFRYFGARVKLTQPTNYPSEITEVVKPAFQVLFERTLEKKAVGNSPTLRVKSPETRRVFLADCKRSQVMYRATGVCLLKLSAQKNVQMDLFGKSQGAEKLDLLYQSTDRLSSKYGKHTVFLGASMLAHTFEQHLGSRGDKPKRKSELFKGETARKRLAIPMLDL